MIHKGITVASFIIVGYVQQVYAGGAFLPPPPQSVSSNKKTQRE